MTDTEIIRNLVMQNLGKRLTIRMCQEAGAAGYTARNRVGEIFRDELQHLGFTKERYTHDKALGEGVWDNGWIISPPLDIPTPHHYTATALNLPFGNGS